MSQRIEYIDGVNAFAIVLMIVGHCKANVAIPHLNNLIYSFHMPLFFILSVFFVKPLTMEQGIRKYAKAYLKPYFTICVLLMLMAQLRGLISGYSFNEFLVSLKTWCVKIFFASGWPTHDALWADIPPIGVLWFLFALFWAASIYSVMKRYLSAMNLAMAAILCFFFAVESVHVVRMPFSLQAGFSGVMFLWIGDVAWHHDVISRLKDVKWWIATLLILSCLFVIYRYGKMNMSSLSYDPIAFRIPVAVALSLFSLIVFR